MKISAKLDYACKALLELSLHWPKEEPLCIQTIADNQQIPLKFLTQILLSLKQMGLVQSLRGKSGGYLLVRQPQDISLEGVVLHFGGIDVIAGEKQNVFHHIWQDVNENLREQLRNINFDQIKKQHLSGQKHIMYSI